VPSYLNAFQGADVRAATIAQVLDKTASLYHEAEIFLGQEVRDVSPALLRVLLGAIAYG
jgi:hypothetical protein